MFIPLKDKIRKVIVDTDIGPDCDDAGALALLFNLQKQYDFPISGIVHCCSNPYGAPAADAIATYFGYDIPIATYDKPGFLEDEPYLKYNKFLAENFPLSRKEYPSSTRLYRELLADALDGEYMIITIGTFNTVSELMDSPGDEISPLTGSELFNSKVDCVVSMAGYFPPPHDKGREFNIICDAKAADNFFNKVKVPVYLDTFDIGYDVSTGFEGREDSQSPVSAAYCLYRPDTHNNASFDLAAIHFAVLGEGEYYTVDYTAGRLETDVEGDGCCGFVKDPLGMFYRIHRNCTAKVLQDTFNALMIKK